MIKHFVTLSLRMQVKATGKLLASGRQERYSRSIGPRTGRKASILCYTSAVYQLQVAIAFWYFGMRVKSLSEALGYTSQWLWSTVVVVHSVQQHTYVPAPNDPKH